MDLFLHRRDLRIHDNAGLAEAENPVPVFVADPHWFQHNLVSDQRKEFVLESLQELDRIYRRRGSKLILKHGRTEKVLESLEDEFDRIVFNRDPNHFRQGLERRLRKNYTDVPNSPATESIGREHWDRRIQEWFSADRTRIDEELNDPEIESDLKIEDLRDQYSIQPEKNKPSDGGPVSGRRKLGEFMGRIDEYSGCVSPPMKAESGTSHLSPYIRYGCISPRYVYQQVEERIEESSSRDMFQDRIVWQQHFNRKLEDNPELFEKAINPVYQDLHKQERDKEKIEAWKNGKTGYPLVDASMRALVETGWLNFRMRAMCASFYSYILKQWWKEGADFFYKHLIDADVAINYYQWQMQSGLVGVHANRVYDPTKQVRENDPEGEFVKKYVPELRGVPKEFIAEPWKMPERIQESCGVIIGEDYPEPIVEYEREARKAREFFKAKAPEAYASFRDDEVWKKASLSSRHDRDEILEKADDSQEDLMDFQS